MTQCFKDHECDNENLNENTIPISECKTEIVERDGVMTKVTIVPVLTCECIWHYFQREAEEIVAPGGVLIADPLERNRAINAAYARLWLHDERFQWAGLAAFASKQVGCGLLHATKTINAIQAEEKALQKLQDKRWALITPGKKHEAEQALRDYQQAAAANPVVPWNLRAGLESAAIEIVAVQDDLRYVHDMMALGNTSLFLDVFPLHAFYAKRGLKELKQCLKSRQTIYDHPKLPVLWPIGQERVRFGRPHEEILQAFEAIEAGDIAKSVVHLAWHEQQNILQPSMYEDSKLVRLLRSNHISYVINFPSGLAQAIELTLASQCQRIEDGRTIGFDSSVSANLADLDQRMPFVIKAATRFHKMLHDENRSLLEQSIKDIADGRGAQ
ncbi:DUF2515 family protein [Pseudomonas sp. NA-150]|uniref:DUF2515 family protein n=1 Tax=Pseudomonas sp. NA-150 TaxID=3367525 RepID=UPI0037C70584